MKKKKSFYICSTLCATIFLLTVVFYPNFGQTGQASKGCASCHESLAAKLPTDHPQVQETDLNGCLSCHSEEGEVVSLEWSVHFHHFLSDKFTNSCGSCHESSESDNFRLTGTKGRAIKIAFKRAEDMQPYFKSWAKSDLLDQGHAKEKVSCGDCHESFFPEERASEENCLNCHESYLSVAEKTKNLKPNPHDSHLGDIRCTLCHKAHEESVDYCAECHTFNFSFSAKERASQTSGS